MIEINKVYNIDCIEGLKQLDRESIDLIITDPPYNINKAEWDNFGDTNEFIKWCDKWVTQCFRVLKENGSLYVIIDYHYLAEIKVLIHSKGFLFKNILVWRFKEGYGTNRNYSIKCNFVLYFIKGVDTNKFREYLNKQRIRKGLTLHNLNESFGVATTGGGCASSWLGDKKDTTLPTKRQYYKLKEILELDNRFDNWFKEKRDGYTFNFKDILDPTVKYDKRLKNPLGANPSNVWDIRIVNYNDYEYTKHPTQKPEKLFQRIIKASSNEGDLVLDPFIGSGTIAFACKSLNRNFIGFEISKEYCEIINKRLKQQTLLNSKTKSTPIPPITEVKGILGGFL